MSTLLTNNIVVYNHREGVDDREFDFALLIKNVGIMVIAFIRQENDMFALTTEMYRKILQGVFTGTKVEGIPATNLLAKSLKKPA